jgi:formiminoglutamase
MSFTALELYGKKELLSITRVRENEKKIGEEVSFIKKFPDDLIENKSKFVLLGIPEDIGVRANFGRGGAHTAWKPALENILNLQSNDFMNGSNLLVLGHINLDQLMNKSFQLNNKTEGDIHKLRKLVEEIDEIVFSIMKEIFQHGKIPIVIGGGHNNSYPIIKAAAKSSSISKINVINCDPHTDFRKKEGRHSGNGFRYAFDENYLNKYSVFGLHESYNSAEVIAHFNSLPERLHLATFEDIFIRQISTFENAIYNCVQFCKDSECGLEIDLDAITNVPSSAKTSSGLSALQARQFIYSVTKNIKPIYFHIAEGAPVLAHIKADNKTGKLIAYLVSDFIKTMNS